MVAATAVGCAGIRRGIFSNGSGFDGANFGCSPFGGGQWTAAIVLLTAPPLRNEVNVLVLVLVAVLTYGRTFAFRLLSISMKFILFGCKFDSDVDVVGVVADGCFSNSFCWLTSFLHFVGTAAAVADVVVVVFVWLKLLFLLPTLAVVVVAAVDDDVEYIGICGG